MACRKIDGCSLICIVVLISLKTVQNIERRFCRYTVREETGTERNCVEVYKHSIIGRKSGDRNTGIKHAEIRDLLEIIYGKSL